MESAGGYAKLLRKGSASLVPKWLRRGIDNKSRSRVRVRSPLLRLFVDALIVCFQVGHVVVFVFFRQLQTAYRVVHALAGFHCCLRGSYEIAGEVGVFLQVG